MILPFIAFVVAAVCFFLQAAVSTDIEHLIDWGLFAVAVGLALWVLGVGPTWARRPQ